MTERDASDLPGQQARPASLDRTRPLAGKVGVVTGGSRGIGFAIARLFVALGANVLIVSRREDSLAAAVQAIRTTVLDAGTIDYCVGAADQQDAARTAVSRAVNELGGLDILINNAGTNPHFGPLTGLTRAQADKTTAVNLYAPLMWAQVAWEEAMSEHGGVILNISSEGAFVVQTNIAWYNATKAALLHLTRHLAASLAPTVRVNAIAPGLIKTDMSRALWADGDDGVASSPPMGRLGEPEDIAEAAAFLCSETASWITGQTLVVDGGALITPVD
jgi:NAD(P)-dependent dehydrogenase (short-subunit alcohol dehydrogenase family)